MIHSPMKFIIPFLLIIVSSCTAAEFKGDAVKVRDAKIGAGNTGGASIVTSETADFLPSCVGKMIWGIESATGAARLPLGVITARHSASKVSVSTTASGDYQNIHLVYGSDDTAALISAAEEADARQPKGCVHIPSGGYIFTQTPFVFTRPAYEGKRPSIIGDGAASTFFFPTPGASSVQNCLFNYDIIDGSNVMEGFTVDGSFRNASGLFIVYESSSANYNQINDVRVVNFTSAFSLITISAATTCRNIHLEQSAGGRGLYCNGHVTLVDSYIGNCGYIGLDITNGGAHVRGGRLDECTYRTVSVQNGALNLSDTIVYAGAGKTAITVDATGVLRASGSLIEPFDFNNHSTGVLIEAGGKAFLNQCTLEGSGTGYGLNNEGTVYDGGNNECNTKTGTGTITTLTL